METRGSILRGEISLIQQFKIFGVTLLLLILTMTLPGTLPEVFLPEAHASHQSGNWGIDSDLVQMIDVHAPNYYRTEWNISLSQYKAWIALIILREAGIGRYAAHSQFGGGINGDRFNHVDAGDNFRFSTGIGAFQLDRGGSQGGASEDWSRMPTIEKINPEMSLLSVLRWHRDRFNWSGVTLADFSENSAWVAMQPSNEGQFAPTWQEITGSPWDASKNSKVDVNFNPPTVNDSFENSVQFIGKLRWYLDKFDGCFDTWLITPHNWSGYTVVLGGYYYTYREDTGWEVWVWNDPDSKLIYRFERYYINTQFPENRIDGAPIASAGSTGSSPALDPNSASNCSGLANSPWPMFQHDAQHTGRSGLPGPQVGAVSWFTDVGNTVSNEFPRSSQPVISSEGVTYLPLGYDDGNPPSKLYAINSDGSIKWVSFDLEGIPTTPAIGNDGTIYVGIINYQLGLNGVVYAINPANGAEKWRFTCTELGFVQAITLGPDGTVYFACGSLVYALNPDGTEKWRYGSLNHQFGVPPAIGPDGTIYAVYGGFCGLTNAEVGWIYAINPDGSLKWTNRYGDYDLSIPAIGPDGTIYVVTERLCGSNGLTAISPNGEQRWFFREAGFDWVGVGFDGSIIAGASDQFLPGQCCRRGGYVYAFTNEGERLWTFERENERFSGFAIDAQGTIFIPSQISSTSISQVTRVYAIKDGLVQWSVDVGGLNASFPGHPVIGATKQLYLPVIVELANYGEQRQLRLYAIGEGSTPPGTAATFRVERQTGNVYAGQYFCGLSSNCYVVGNADIAERIDISELVEPGDLVEIDPNNLRQYRKAQEPYSPRAAGVISINPGFALANQPEELPDKVQLLQLFSSRLTLSTLISPQDRPWLSALLNKPREQSWNRGIAALAERLERVQVAGRPLLALMGRVKVKATTENGPIQVGDLLVSSSRPGYAMRCAEPSRCAIGVIGKALEPLREGEGLIEILVMR